MNIIQKIPAPIAALLLICLFAVGFAGAYDANTACDSANDIIAATNNTTALELVVFYTDYGLSQSKIWTEDTIHPEEFICGGVRRAIEEENDGRTISDLIITTVSGNERVSYKLSPETSLFERMAEPVDFPDQKKYADKMMLYFKIIGYHGKDTVLPDASSLDPENLFQSRNGITPSMILDDLSGSQGTRIPASSFISNAALNLGNTIDTRDSLLSRVANANTDRVIVRKALQTGQRDFTSIGSQIIGNYHQS